MKIFVVNYKETTINSDNVMEVESGVCDDGYTNEKDAINKINKLCDDKMNEFIDDIDEEKEKIENGDMNEDDIQVYHESNKSRDWQCVYHYDNTYEYWVTIVYVE